MYITGNEKGLPPLPGITRLAVDAYDNAGYEGDWKLSFTSIEEFK